jgi:hypothetical protein
MFPLYDTARSHKFPLVNLIVPAIPAAMFLHGGIFKLEIFSVREYLKSLTVVISTSMARRNLHHGRQKISRNDKVVNTTHRRNK